MKEFETLIKHTKKQYYKLIIINDEKTDTHNPNKYKEYCLEREIPLIDLSVKLAELLVDIPKKDRDQEAADKIRDYFYHTDKDEIALDNLSYLFSPEVGKINPVSTFNYLTRSRKTIILFIKARKKGNLLIYSNEGLDDYMELDISNNEGFVLGW